jgi:hypothetical protein
MTVRELLERCDSAELAEWMKYYELEPFGDEWEKTAAICETIAIFGGGQNVNRNYWRPVRRKPRQQTPEEMNAEFAKMAAFLKNAGVKKQKPQE